LRAVGVILCWVFNGSDSLVVTGRDKDATWRTLGTLCRELGWPWGRLHGELIARRAPYRTHPPGEIDWGDSTLRVDLAESKVTILDRHSAKTGVTGFYKTVWVEVLPPTDASPAPSLPPTAASSSPPASPRKNVSEAELRECILTIKTERPNDPPDEDELWKEVERRLNAMVSRDRLRQVRDDVAPEWKLPIGRPRKSAQ
jgi:hypothetical protein